MWLIDVFVCAFQALEAYKKGRFHDVSGMRDLASDKFLEQRDLFAVARVENEKALQLRDGEKKLRQKKVGPPKYHVSPFAHVVSHP